MKLNCCIFFILLLFSQLEICAQYLALSSINFIEKYHINHCYAGISGNRILGLNIRQQWIDLNSSPKLFNADFFSPVHSVKGGMGAGIEYNDLGGKKIYGLHYSYNYIYRAVFGDLSAGIGARYRGLFLDKDKIRTPDGFFENGTYNPNDNYLTGLFGDNLSSMRITYSFLYLFRNLEFGIEFDKGIAGLQKVGITDSDLLKINIQYQYLISDILILRLNFALLSDFIISQSETGVTALLKNSYIVGINLRGYSRHSFESLGLYGGTDISRNLKLIYAYEIGLGSLAKVHNGSHQIMVIVNLGRPEAKHKLPPVIYNPRLY